MNLSKFAVALLLLGLGATACGGGTAHEGVTPGKKIAFLVPDTSPRYASQDAPLFQAKVRSICSDCEVLYRNAGGDAGVQRQQADATLASNLKRPQDAEFEQPARPYRNR